MGDEQLGGEDLHRLRAGARTDVLSLLRSARHRFSGVGQAGGGLLQALLRQRGGSAQGDLVQSALAPPGGVPVRFALALFAVSVEA